jgi:hypothetical protein
MAETLEEPPGRGGSRCWDRLLTDTLILYIIIS